MFSRKKRVAQVRELDDDEDLLVAPPPMPESEVAQREAALKEVRAGKKATESALRTALQARETGVETAGTLRDQTAQLERMNEDTEYIHNTLDVADQHIWKIETPRIKRIFRCAPKGGQALKHVKPGRREQEERNEYRDEGVGTARARLLAGRTAPGGVREIQDDYSEYDVEVAEVMKAQDNDLDRIGDAVGDLEMLSKGMNNELKLQEELLDQVHAGADATNQRLDAMGRKMRGKKR